MSVTLCTLTGLLNSVFPLQIAQLIRDENQRCNKIEELFKFREKTLNDKTKKLMQLEEQKRALKDTGQDSRSVKKKQRALILKLQQEKDEISRWGIFMQLCNFLLFYRTSIFCKMYRLLTG